MSHQPAGIALVASSKHVPTTTEDAATECPLKLQQLHLEVMLLPLLQAQTALEQVLGTGEVATT